MCTRALSIGNKINNLGWPWTHKRPLLHHCIFRNGDFQPLYAKICRKRK